MESSLGRGYGAEDHRLVSAKIREIAELRAAGADGARRSAEFEPRHRASPPRTAFVNCPVCNTPMMQRTLELHQPQCYNAKLRAENRSRSKSLFVSEAEGQQMRSVSASRDLLLADRPRALRSLAPSENAPEPAIRRRLLLRARSDGRGFLEPSCRGVHAADGQQAPSRNRAQSACAEAGEQRARVRGRERREHRRIDQSDTDEVALRIEELQEENNREMAAHRCRSSGSRCRRQHVEPTPAAIIVASARRTILRPQPASEVKPAACDDEDAPRVRYDTTRKPPSPNADLDATTKTPLEEDAEEQPRSFAPRPATMLSARKRRSRSSSLQGATNGAGERVEILSAPLQRSPSPLDRATHIILSELAYCGEDRAGSSRALEGRPRACDEQKAAAAMSLDVAQLLQQGKRSTKPLSRPHELISLASPTPPLVGSRAARQQSTNSPPPTPEPVNQVAATEAPEPRPDGTPVTAAEQCEVIPSEPFCEQPQQREVPTTHTSARAKIPRFCWQCGAAHPLGVTPNFCCQCGAVVPTMTTCRTPVEISA